MHRPTRNLSGRVTGSTIKVNIQIRRYPIEKPSIKTNNHPMRFLTLEMHFINRINLKKQANNLLRVQMKMMTGSRSRQDYIILETLYLKQINCRKVLKHIKTH